MFQYDVAGFVPKNQLNKYLYESIKRAITLIEEDRPYMQILPVYMPNRQEKYMDMKIPLNDIILIESINKVSYVHTTRDTYQVYHIQFTKLVEKFTGLGFLDIHRTCIVNPKYVSSVGESNIYLDNGEILIMSRRKRKEVLNKLVNNIYEEVIR